MNFDKEVDKVIITKANATKVLSLKEMFVVEIS